MIQYIPILHHTFQANISQKESYSFSNDEHITGQIKHLNIL